MANESVAQYLASDDPLSLSAIAYLLSYGEEDTLVDYKESFDKDDEHAWLELTKDIMAFANADGGYLVFGVRDGSFELVGLPERQWEALSDTNLLHQKINRFLDPEIANLRTKRGARKGRRYVAVFVPRSDSAVHIFKDDGISKFPSGKDRYSFRKGTFLVRRSAGNHLADSGTIEAIFRRRLVQFREAMLDKISRVVEAPTDSQMFLVTPDNADETAKSFVIADAPDAIPVKGMSFTVCPATFEQQVASWIAISGTDPTALPPRRLLWKWYQERHGVQLTPEQRVRVAAFCLHAEVPVFTWLRGCPAADIKSMLSDIISRKVPGDNLSEAIDVASFLGKRFHRSLVSRMGAFAERLGPRHRAFPPGGPQSLYSPGMVEAQRVRRPGEKKERSEVFRRRIEKELSEIAGRVNDRTEQPNSSERARARSFDCFLYAQSDQYAGAKAS